MDHDLKEKIDHIIEINKENGKQRNVFEARILEKVGYPLFEICQELAEEDIYDMLIAVQQIFARISAKEVEIERMSEEDAITAVAVCVRTSIASLAAIAKIPLEKRSKLFERITQL